jgi:Zn-dependent peptidase ImmA (M78 family)/DNA-binding XRE family transcriptional regulator
MTTPILDTIDRQQLGKRLQLARKKQGLTQADAANVIGVARTTITAIEQGERRLKADELIKLAEAYGRDVSDFVTNRPVIERPAIQFRSTSSRTVVDEETVTPFVDQLLDLCIDYIELERMTGKVLTRNYPTPYRYDHYSGQSEKAAEAVAMAERNRLGVGDGPLPILRDFLEQFVGLRIFYLPLMPSQIFAEIYFYDDDLGGCVAINSQHRVGRRRWSLAHAYAHFLVHRTKPTVTFLDNYRRKPESEHFADSFSKFFLLPTNGVTQRFNALYQANGRITPADLVQLAHYYGASFQALVLRLEEMYLLPSGIWQKLQERGFRVEDAQEQLGLPSMPDDGAMLPRRYQQLALEAYESAELSEGQLAKFLRTDRLTARTIAAEAGEQDSFRDAIEHDVLDLFAA